MTWTVDWGRKWLVGFNAEKTQLVPFDWSNKTGAVDVKMDGSVPKMLGLTFSSTLDWSSYIISNAKTATKKIGALICSIKLQKWICKTVGPSLAASLEPFVYCRNVASLSLFCRYSVGVYCHSVERCISPPFFFHPPFF